MRRRITTGEFSVLKTAPIGHKLYKRKNKFYNPVWQNSTQVLKEYLGEAVEKIPIYSIIVFGNQADFKFKEPFTKARVIKRRELLSVIKNTPGDDSVSHSQRQKIRQLLSRLDIEDQKGTETASQKTCGRYQEEPGKKRKLGRNQQMSPLRRRTRHPARPQQNIQRLQQLPEMPVYCKYMNLESDLNLNIGRSLSPPPLYSLLRI